MIIRLACAAVMAAVATAAQAGDAIPGGAAIMPAPLSFNASLYGGLGRGAWDNGAMSWDIALYGAEAHLGAQSGSVGVEGDVWGSGARYSGSDGSTWKAYFVAAGLHVNRRTDDGVFGGLVSIATMPEGYDDTYLNTALEGQKDFGRLTLGVQAGYVQTIAVTGPSIFSMSAPNAWYVHGIARWFPNDDLMLAGDFGYAGVHGDVDQAASVPRWGARLEYKAKSAPVAGFVAYQGYHWDQGGDTAGAIHTVMVGITFIGGGETLAARYRGPAGLDDRNPIYGVEYTP